MVKIKVYKITGNQLFFRIPEKWCIECDLSVAVARKVASEIGEDKVAVVVKPWLNSLLEVLPRGGWHAPVVMVKNKIVSQGIIPDYNKLKKEVIKSGSL